MPVVTRGMKCEMILRSMFLTFDSHNIFLYIYYHFVKKCVQLSMFEGENARQNLFLPKLVH